MTLRLPVIIGVGEIVDRPDDLQQSLEPLALMAEALRRAALDSHADALKAIDSLDVVHQVSWRYEKTAQRLCERLGIRPPRAVYGVTGGESPMRYIHEAALRIARGEAEVAAVCGGESQYAVNKAKSANATLPWTAIAKDVENPFAVEGRLNPVAIAHGAIRPIHVYPFYENATHLQWGQTPGEALIESGEMWSRFSQVAANNSYSWSRKPLSTAQIISPSIDNRLICYPYTKHMVANPAVNQGAAVILTTLERARAMGVDESKMIFILGGACANEPRDYLLRDQYVRSDAQDIVLNAMRELSHANGRELQATELYSCFPCVPKMTRRVLELSANVTPTVTGGLSFFGAPLNNYMTHATCAMTRHLRAGHAATGLLYGQGEFITKHHALLVSRLPPNKPMIEQYSLQSRVDRRRNTIPPLAIHYAGTAIIESHSVVYDRDGRPAHGTIIALTPDGTRVMARVPAADRDAIARLVTPNETPIGLRIDVMDDGHGLLQARLQ